MSDKYSSLSQAEAHRAFTYVPETGHMLWAINRSRAKAGNRAGTLRPDGYRMIHIYDGSYYAHVLTWMYCTGSWPTTEIDHINGDKDDNRIENLRQVSRVGNLQNFRKAFVTNQTGKWGVRFDRRCKSRPFRAMAWENGKNVSLGYYATADEAEQVALKWKRENHATCTI